MSKLLINASNIKSGGALQVSISFITELSKLNLDNKAISLIISEQVYDALKASKINLLNFKKVTVQNNFGLAPLNFLNSSFAGFDIIFTIFGPFYFFHYSYTKYVTGFAQPWLVYSTFDVSKKYSTLKKLFLNFKFKIQAVFFSFSDYLIVETQDVKNRIADRLCQTSHIFVVTNCISRYYLNPKLHSSESFLSFNFPKGINICYIGSDYPHKNINILPYVKEQLKLNFNFDVNFLVTFSKEEWEKKDVFFRKNILNVGRILPSQCPTLYENVDGVILPSLLECSSALPLEAMAMKKPFFGSNRDFIKDTCKNFGFYFDPLSAYSIAKTIFDYFNTKSMHEIKILDAYNYIQSLPNAKDRCLNYLSIIESI